MITATTRQQYEAVIGIETHVQLKTASKMFCGCSNNAREAAPNTLICPVCTGQPGSLPYLNEMAVMLALRAGLVLEGKIASETKFDRKNYFYPDLPKGYQISQYDQPIVGPGKVYFELDGKRHAVGITRAHLEEDAGKLTHPEGAEYSLLDMNRCGTPLLEIVSEPDMRSPAEAKAYVRELYNLMRYAEISDVDLFHGNMRFDINVSLRKRGSSKLGIRTETKNLNSFRSVERATQFEIDRQLELLAKGGSVNQETRGWDEVKQKTFAQRSKEEAHDYRYFPEPDIPPLAIQPVLIEAVRKSMPMLPGKIRQTLKGAGLSRDQIETLLNQPQFIKLVLGVIELDDKFQVGRIANWLARDVQTVVSRPDFKWADFRLTPQSLIELAQMVETDQLSSSGAEQILLHLIEKTENPLSLAKKLKLLQISDSSEVAGMVKSVLEANPQAVSDFKNGNQQSLQFLVGQVMKQSRGQANPKTAQEILLELLK